MLPAVREIGLGVLVGEFTIPNPTRTFNSVMVTQNFALSGPDVFLTGVAYDDLGGDGDEFYTPGEGEGGVSIEAVRAGDGAVFSTTTWASGGYTLALPTGTYRVTASSAAMGVQVFDNVVIDAINVKLDVTTQPAPATRTWDGADGADWTDAHWSPGPAGPAGGEAMVVDSGRANVSSDLSATPAASLAVASGAPGGTVTVASAGQLHVTGSATVGAGGTLSVDGVLTAGAVDITGGSLTNSRTSTGDLTVNGPVTLSDGATLTVDLLGADMDTLTSNAAVTIQPGASLEIIIAGGADTFQAGTYTLIQAASLSGTFANVTGLGAYVSVNGTGLTYNQAAGTLTLTLDLNLHPGDGNLDGATDVSDRIIWNNNNFLEGTTWATGDYNNDGATDVSDRIVWNNNNFTEAAIPQPVAVALEAPAAIVLRAAPSEPESAGQAEPDNDASTTIASAPSLEVSIAPSSTPPPSSTESSPSRSEGDTATSEAQLELDLSSDLDNPLE